MRWRCRACLEELRMKSAARFAVACLGLYVLQGWAAEPTILVDQVGYERQAGKKGIVSGDAGQALQDFQVIATRNGKPIYSGTLLDTGTVDKWGSQHYWRADFSSIHAPGRYVLALKGRG